jgi:hypothetical protein
MRQAVTAQTEIPTVSLTTASQRSRPARRAGEEG